MRNRLQLTLLTTALFCLFSYEGVSAQSSAPMHLNTIKIGQCPTSTNFDIWVKAEQARGLVMDARPFAINQSVGRVSFEGSAARVSVINMNPFVYNYKISVAQQEIANSAITDFLKLVLPSSLQIGGLQSGTVRGVSVSTPTSLAQIEGRLNDFTSSQCKNPKDPLSNTPECAALNEMYDVFYNLKTAMATKFTAINSPTIIKSGSPVDANAEFIAYTKLAAKLQNEGADAKTICDEAQSVDQDLGKYDFDAYFNDLNTAQDSISAATDLANDLAELVKAFKADSDLSTGKPIIRCKGFNCLDQFDAYSKVALQVLGGYGTKVNDLKENAQKMKNMFDLTEQMKNEDGLFARTFTVPKKFELSQATISVNRTSLTAGKQNQSDTNAKGTQSGTPPSTKKPPTPSVTGGTSSGGTGSMNHVVDDSSQTDNQGGSDTDTTIQTEPLGNAKNLSSAGQINEGVLIGRQRFTLSGGLVYSPLPRRTFESVKGFTKDAQGNPTGDGSANIVGFGQNSPRRLLPMVFLNSRLLSFKPTSIYFSVGVTAKHDDNLDIEYLFGPSVGLLNNRALFTFGAYAGRTQKLVSDVKLGDELPDGLGNAKLYRKGYTWKPGFSFSYSFASKATKEALASKASGDSKPAADDLNNEIHIGSIPFNLAVGFAYTSLEQRTYDAIVGFARDRQGKLTNGQTLTRIVGLTSSSNYRLTPLAMLHSRLTHFSGGHDLYFSTGVTGKKTDNDFDIEYMLGGSINLYQRKVFLTLGVFAGKQQVLGGNFFEGAKLGQDQGVTTENRYVWKPAVSISYDISRIIPGH